MKKYVDELRTRAQVVKSIVEDSTLSWEHKFSQIFSDSYSVRICALFRNLNIDFDWYNPDMDYEDDVRAFVNALEERMKNVDSLLNTLAEADLAPVTDESNGKWIAVYGATPDIYVSVGTTEDEAIMALVTHRPHLQHAKHLIQTACVDEGQAVTLTPP